MGSPTWGQDKGVVKNLDKESFETGWNQPKMHRTKKNTHRPDRVGTINRRTMPSGGGQANSNPRQTRRVGSWRKKKNQTAFRFVPKKLDKMTVPEGDMGGKSARTWGEGEPT